MAPLDRRGLRLSLPARPVRPHTFQDDVLAALVGSIPRVGLYSSIVADVRRRPRDSFQPPMWTAKL
jgi:hypothetical protein